LIYSTRGIVLHKINYGETSVVTKIYTELFGLQSYIINGVRSKKAKIKSNILQPLSVLDMEVYNRDKKSLQHVQHANAVNPASQIGMDVIKGSLAIFIAEVLYRSIREEEPNQELFNFLLKLIAVLENADQGVANYHVFFMLEFSTYLGFYPDNNSYEKGFCFDKREGVFCKDVPAHGDWMDAESSGLLSAVIESNLDGISNIVLTTTQRNDLVEHLIAYYNLHLHTKIEIRSYKVLQTVMH